MLSSDYCGLIDGSQEGDWRLPNRNEPNSLIDLGEDNPAKPDGCPITQAAIHPYWSATSFSSFDGSAWMVEFTFGKIDYDQKDEEHWVLCVRGGQ
ncbi:MAG: DUF1566 domain-containing protein [Muriicola sp.]|nr:DUF1566 domain-containing protein [Muriicola sp.]